MRRTVAVINWKYRDQDEKGGKLSMANKRSTGARVWVRMSTFDYCN